MRTIVAELSEMHVGAPGVSLLADLLAAVLFYYYFAVRLPPESRNGFLVRILLVFGDLHE